MNTELVIALDYSDPKKAESLMASLQGMQVIYKVGLELFISAGPDWVRGLTDRGERIFLDMKFHDIPNTVAQAVVQAAKLGVEFVTVHLSGGKRMLDEINFRLTEAIERGEVKKRPNILGVSVLSSFKEEEWVATLSNMAKISGIRPIQDAVNHFANLAANHPGVFGMVCSPHEVASVRVQHQNLFLMIPGIRMTGEDSQDQSRVMSPREAKKAGASAIVVGRPITQAEDPVLVVRTYLGDLKS